jgi:hypothetical protein
VVRQSDNLRKGAALNAVQIAELLLGFGLGWSFASEPPVNEARRGNDGVTSREKWYWTFEMGFKTAADNRDLVLRLHHRSTGFSTVGEGRSTNALVIGIRQSF